MRRHVDARIARGPTMSADGKSVTGSMHIVDLPDAAAAQAFVRDDPLARGGVFETTLVRRFHNVADRTMWQFDGNPANPRLLFIGQARPGSAERGRAMREAQRAWLERADRAVRVIVHGPLLGAGGEAWDGTAIMLEAPDTAAAEALVRGDPAAASDLYARADLHPWHFGGEESLRDLVAGQ